ncbi:ATP-dependent DNA helicase [Brevundimonas sp. BR2-1]|uniref:ATP-dependent helicase n=1 Tax=Brevundimonas sp. BR2-1 TaxID=3031123 RepID=UPI003096A18C
MITPTPAQQEAIDHVGGNLLIVACAGSGKTEAISRRIARIVRDGDDGKADGASKDAIVAFTFTEHAAAELKARVRRHLELIVPEEPSLGDMYVGTIHSFCLRLLKELSSEFRNWEVMDEVRQAALISANFTRWEDSNRGLGLDRLRGETRTGTYWETVRRFTTTLNIMHQKGIGPADLDNRRLADVVERYQVLAYERPNYFVDFNRIIDQLIERLKTNPADLSKIQSKFRHIVVDEYQDVDDRQEELIQLLSGYGRTASVTAVGDDDQALYGFRGASVHNILTFSDRYPDVRRVDLVENFRCTHAIVEIADQAIKKVPERLAKEMSARRRNPAGEVVERLADPGDIQLALLPSEEAEAEWVADRIAALRGVVFEEKDGTTRALDYADMAILLRSVKTAGNTFARVLRDRGIPVVVSGTRGLFNNDEVRLIQAAFCLLSRADFAMPDDEGQLQILNTLETREFVRDCIGRLRQHQMTTASASHFLGWIGSKLEELDRRNQKREERGRLAKRIYPQEIFQEMLHALGSQDGPWTSDVMFNLGAFSTLLAQFEAVHQWVTPSNLKGLCLFLGNWAASNADEGGLDEVVRLNSVQIMTVHAAKGLEWPVVFLPRISSSNFPSSRRNHGPETFLSPGIFDPSDYAGGDAGERRLWYVGLTRSAKFLNVTSLDRPRKKPTDYYKEIHHHIVRRDGSDPTVRQRDVPRPPDDADMLPTTFSDLTYWWRCPQEYQLRSLMGFGPGVGEQYGYGQQLHNILAEIHDLARSGTVPSIADVEKLVSDRFHLRYTQGPPLDALKEAARKALVRYVQENAEALSRTHSVEKPFEFIDKESGALITGVVDLLERADHLASGDSHREAVGIVDFKAHRITSPEQFDELKQQAERQLRLYAHAVQYAFPYQPAIATAQLITPRGPSKELASQGVTDRINVDVSSDSQDAALDEVRAAVSGIKTSLKTQNFPCTGPINGWCKRCDFRTFCPGFSIWRDRNKSSPPPPPPAEEREAEVNAVMEEQNAGS